MKLRLLSAVSSILFLFVITSANAALVTRLGDLAMYDDVAGSSIATTHSSNYDLFSKVRFDYLAIFTGVSSENPASRGASASWA